MLLAIYLNDHLAGSTVGRELARRTAQSNRSSSYGPALSELAGQIDEDRRALLNVMATLDVSVDRLKVAAGWSAEKLGRLKLNGRLRGYSPLSRVVEIEAMALGVHGKLAMWRTLERLVDSRPALREIDLAALAQRAESQLEQLERCRVEAVTEALS